MPAERFYLPSLFEGEKEFTLSDLEFHHLVHVMRTREKELIELVNGQGQLALATVEKIEKKRVILSLNEIKTELEPLYSLTLAQALPRTSRLEFILEKGTELGVTEFRLFPSTRSEKNPLLKIKSSV